MNPHDDFDQWDASMRSLQLRAEAAEAALARLQQDFSTLCVLARRDHSVCDDLYYSCPSSGAHPHGNDGTCDCGAAEHNAKVDAIVNGLMPRKKPAPLDAPDGPFTEEQKAYMRRAYGLDEVKMTDGRIVSLVGAIAERDALSAWACVSCGARFPSTVAPAALVGVTRCASCCELDALRGQIDHFKSLVLETREKIAANAAVWQAQHDALVVERDQARRDVSMRDQLAEIDMGRLREANTALAEARRVLREVEWHPCHGDYDGATRYACPMCDYEDREHAPDCALATILAHEESV